MDKHQPPPRGMKFPLAIAICGSLCLHLGLGWWLAQRPSEAGFAADDAWGPVMLVDLTPVGPGGALTLKSSGERRAYPAGKGDEEDVSEDDLSTRADRTGFGRDRTQATADELSLAARIAEALAEPTSGGAPSSYQAVLDGHIARYRATRYAARTSGRKGARIGFRLDRRGELLSTWVVSTSGDRALDGAALQMLWRANPMPPVPSEIEAPLDVQLTIYPR